MPSFFDRQPTNELNNEIDKFEELAKENTILNSSQKVGFTDKNSVLTFESPPSDDAISLGEPIQLNTLEIEELDISKHTDKPSEQVKLDFEEL